MQRILARRRQLLGMLTAEKNRLPTATKPVAKRIAAHIRWLEKELSRIDRDLEETIKSSSALSENEELLRSVPGVGPVLARTLLAEVPELGALTHKRVAALVGVAPLNRDSGTLRGRRSIWGGRAEVRAALYMGALVAARRNPAIREFYELPEHCAFEYTYRAVKGRMAFMEWAYEDRSCPPRPAEFRGLRRVLMQALQGCLKAGRTGVDRREPLCAHYALPLSRSGARFSTGWCWWITRL